jgi:hypothetical protein
MAKNSNVSREVKELVLAKVQDVLNKPRVSAYSPSSLVEIVRHLLSLGFDNNKIEKLLYKDYSTSKAWWICDEGEIDFSTTQFRLQRTVDALYDETYSV